jgi:hypothetical protein
LNKLRELITAEIARRDNSENMMPAFWFVVHDMPGALTDVDEAVAAIVKAADSEPYGAVMNVSPSIANAVMDALHRDHPRRMTIRQDVVRPGASQRKRGLLVEQPELPPVRVSGAEEGMLQLLLSEPRMA